MTVFKHKMKIRRQTPEEQKTVKFPHRTRTSQTTQRVIHFPRRHPTNQSPHIVEPAPRPPPLPRPVTHPSPIPVPKPTPIIVPKVTPPTKPKPKVIIKKQVLPPNLDSFASESLIKPEDKVPKNLVSIIILSYNTMEILWECLVSVLLKTKWPYELIVVDNGSTDGTIEWLKTQEYLVLIVNEKNLGWAKGNNVGIRKARGRYVLLMNSDITVKGEGWLTQMVKVALDRRRHHVGTVGAKLLYPTRRIQHIGGSIHKGSPFHPFDGAPADIPEAKVNRIVPFNTGALLLIPRTTLKKIGLLDESYRFGYADVDYGLKCVQAGLKNIMCRKSVLIHRWAYTQRKYKKWIPPKSIVVYERNWLHKLDKLSKDVEIDWSWPRGAMWIREKGPGSHVAHMRHLEEFGKS